MKKLSLEERWLNKIDESSDDNSCWIWKGSRSTQGYGQMCVNKKQVLTHQIGWNLAGRSPCRGKTYLRNLCGNKLCVNPDHWDKELKVKSLLVSGEKEY